MTLGAGPAAAQDLNARETPPPPAPAAPPADDQVTFSASQLEYDTDTEIVTATGDVRMFRAGERLRADRVDWNRQTGKVTASGNVAVTNPNGDVAYGDRIDLTDSLKDGVVANMLVVMAGGGRIAARQGTRAPDETVTLDEAAYTPCAVERSDGCPKEPSWKITAVRVTYRPDRGRVYYKGARLHLFGLPSLPLPTFSHPVGGTAESGWLSPSLRLDATNGVEYAQPYFWRLAPNRNLTITPHIYSAVLPMLDAEYRQLSATGALRVRGYGTVSRQSDDFGGSGPRDFDRQFRGYLEGVGRYQFDPYWRATAYVRLATDKTFLRRYDISDDDRLRSTAAVERIDPDTYFAVRGWYLQTLRLTDDQGMQAVALPEIDFRQRIADAPLGGMLQLQVNSLALTRTAGQDTQRAFASARWDLRRVTTGGQEVMLTAFARGDAYNSDDVFSTANARYRGRSGFQTRAIGALAAEVRWPFVGALSGGTQRWTPRLQLVAAPRFRNLAIPNEDSRAVDLDDTDLFALNRFSGYDRYEDASRVTYGIDWAADLPGWRIESNLGQSYRLAQRGALFPDGTGLTDRLSDVVGRTEVRWQDFVSLTARYRIDKDDATLRRNEIDATVGSRSTYVLVGYLRLNRDIDTTFEDLQDREEARVGGRVAFSRFWSAFGSAIVDLTDRGEDPFAISDGFDPVRSRLGVEYEDDCLRLGATWRRYFARTGDARAGNSFLLTLAFKNLGR